jgi:HAD superfamily hydrolase (TIGR01484 family)
MDRYDRLYRLYDEFDTAALRRRQDFLDIFPPVDSAPALKRWRAARDALERGKTEVREAFAATAGAEEDPEVVGETFAGIATRATREQAFAALDLYARYERPVNALVLDVDETLRSANATDDEIPRETLYRLREFHDDGVPIVICTGKTLENVKGFLVQGLGSELVHSGRVSVVYEAGSGVFTPDHGAETKRLLYADLDAPVRADFEAIRSRVLRDAPEPVRRGCHRQGNEFNVTLMSNYEAGTDEAAAVVERALVHLLDLVGETVTDDDRGPAWSRAHSAAADPEIRATLERRGDRPDVDADEIPAAVRERLARLDVAYYHADAAEVGSLELNKAVGVRSALSVLGVDDPFVLVMGDSKTDLRVMRWAAEENRGVSAAPRHASESVLSHVRGTDDLVYDPGDAGDVLRTVAALNRLAAL